MTELESPCLLASQGYLLSHERKAPSLYMRSGKGRHY